MYIISMLRHTVAKETSLQHQHCRGGHPSLPTEKTVIITEQTSHQLQRRYWEDIANQHEQLWEDNRLQHEWEWEPCRWRTSIGYCAERGRDHLWRGSCLSILRLLSAEATKQEKGIIRKRSKNYQLLEGVLHYKGNGDSLRQVHWQVYACSSWTLIEQLFQIIL